MQAFQAGDRGSQDMPASYTIDKEKKLVLLRMWGICTVNDVLWFREAIKTDPDFDPDFAELVDLTGVIKATLAPGEVRSLAGMVPFSTAARRALLSEDPLLFGLSRIYETLRSLRGDQHVRVFRKRDEAMAWLFPQDTAA
jgi:hypothetical protein